MDISRIRYRHFKGNIYVVTGIALHSETKEALMLYFREDDPKKAIWARPVGMWNEYVTNDKGEKVRRFEPL